MRSTILLSGVVLMAAAAGEVRPIAAQEAAPRSPACGRPDSTVRKLPFSAEDNADGARFVWFSNCLAGLPYPYVAAKDVPNSPWFVEIDSTSRTGGPRVGDVIWWAAFMATIAGPDGPALSPEGRLSLADLQRKYGTPRYYRRRVPTSSGSPQ